MDNKIKVSVFVAGQRFNIITEKSEKYVLDIASEIDARINSLVISGDMTRERAAVLTALDYADDSETDKENINAVKEQMKDYLLTIERLQDDNAKLVGDYNLLKAEYERLIAEHQSAEDAQKAFEDSKKENEALKEKLKKTQERLESFQQQPESVISEEIPLPEEPPVKEEHTITAEDDLFFDEPEETPVKPQKEKKKRHDHSHVNPYQKKAKEKQDKGYTQQRQYSFFDISDEKD